jgi:hypothetical protein
MFRATKNYFARASMDRKHRSVIISPVASSALAYDQADVGCVQLPLGYAGIGQVLLL